jgi:hypothetical protein
MNRIVESPRVWRRASGGFLDTSHAIDAFPGEITSSQGVAGHDRAQRGM